MRHEPYDPSPSALAGLLATLRSLAPSTALPSPPLLADGAACRWGA